jgi:hypothetical protein
MFRHGDLVKTPDTVWLPTGRGNPVPVYPYRLQTCGAGCLDLAGVIGQKQDRLDGRPNRSCDNTK